VVPIATFFLPNVQPNRYHGLSQAAVTAAAAAVYRSRAIVITALLPTQRRGS